MLTGSKSAHELLERCCREQDRYLATGEKNGVGELFDLGAKKMCLELLDACSGRGVGGWKAYKKQVSWGLSDHKIPSCFALSTNTLLFSAFA